MAAGEVATHAEERKCSKHSSLPVIHDFIPVAIETSCVMRPQSLHFLRELGRRVRTDRLVTHLLPLTCSNACQLPSREETLLPLWEVLRAMTRHSCAIATFMCFTVIVHRLSPPSITVIKHKITEIDDNMLKYQ